MIGKRIAHYEIVRELGEGGMGQVYVALDGRLDREVALKVLPSEVAEDADRLSRFEREAKTLAAINHPNIVTIHSVEEADGVRFMTMELVHGNTLDELIPEDGMALEDLLDIAVPLAAAVAAAHERGIHHRDLKPANVMVTDDGRVKVLDFGLAKHRRDPVAADDATRMLTGGLSDDLTAEGKIVGTVAYMSPEQAQGSGVDHRSDIFSLGIILYEMVTGRRPFQGPNNISILSSILKDEPDSVSDVRDAVPVPLARVVQRALGKRPEDRYQSARDMKQDLADLRRDLQTETAISSGMVSGVHDAQRTEGSRRLLLPAFLLLGVVAAVGVGMALLSVGPFAGPGGGAAGGPGAPPAPPGLATMPARADLPSLAVLPFDNIAGDEELDWMSAGLAEMLTTDLSQAVHLRVLGTDRVHDALVESGHMEDAGDSPAAAAAVSTATGANLVVRGAFVRAGGELRIDARVEDADTGEVLASERVTGAPDAVFDIIDTLSDEVASSIDRTGLSGSERAAMERMGLGDRDLREVTTDSVEAYRLYSEGLRLLHASRPEEAAALFRRAVELDEDFAMAWARLSVAHGNAGRYAAAVEAAGRAREMADRLPPEERLYIEGRYYSLRPETADESIEAYERLLELFPHNTAARNNLATQLMSLERYDRAIPHLERLVEMRTEFTGTYTNLASAYANVDRLDDAIETLRDLVRERPESVDARGSLAIYLARADRYDEAEEQLEAALSLRDDPDARTALATLHAARHDWEEFEQQVAELRAAGTGSYGWVQGHELTAIRQIWFGDKQAAYETLAEARQQIDGDNPHLGDLLNTHAVLAQAMDDHELLLELADDLERSVPTPGATQTAVVNRMIAAAIRGDEEAVRRHRTEFDRIVAGIEIPEAVEQRLEGTFAGIVAMAERDFDTAAAAFARAYDSLASKAATGDSLQLAWLSGWTLWEAGEHERAAPWFERILELELGAVDNPIPAVRSHWYLGKLAEERGNTAAALEHYRRYLHYWGDGEIEPDRVAEAQRFVETHG